MNRREFALSALSAAAVRGRAEAATGQPNIVYVILDDLGMYDTGCYGSRQIATPNIDRVAAEGMKFTEAYSGCTVCAPARSTLMTGKHMGHTSVRANPGGVSLQADDFTIAQMLQKAGYACGGFGKWGIGDLHGLFILAGPGIKQGVEIELDTGKKVPLPGNRDFYRGKPAAGAFPAVDPATGLKRQFSPYLIHGEMQKWLRERRNQPFFCYAPWTLPHGAHEIPESDPAWQLYKDKPWSLDARVHAAFVSIADRFVGETMSLIKELGVDGNTLFLFSSDNGAADTFGGSLNSAGNLRGQKTEMYEGGIRSPFLARFPGKIKAGSTSDLPIYFPDLMPTLAEFTGATALLPKGIDGMSIVPEITGRAKLNRERPMYWEWNEGHFNLPYRVKMQACRKGRWKIVRNDMARPWELYDLSKDPGEQHNLASTNQSVVRELEAWVKNNRVDPPEQVEPSKPEGRQWR
ncbi:MAG: sulfatase-like hydrolase/transferase [Candidatus Solibacter sp.]|nr:sulfatase-like hydrolase/transferase [Candidatus Solibacter sp.]